MIVFDCPACRAKLQVADEHAGKMMRCPTCQHTSTIPSADANAVSAEPIVATPLPPPPPPAPASEPSWDRDRDERERDRDDRDRDRDDDDRSKRRRRRDRDDREDERERPKSGSSTVVIVLAVVGVCGCCGLTLLALMIPAVQKVREAAARTQSINNLKNIGLGFHAFHDANKRLPFNGCDNAFAGYNKSAVGGSIASGSWGFQILPYLDHGPTFVAANRNTPVITFLCPGRGRAVMESPGGAWSDYFYNNYLNDPLKAFTPDNPDMRRTMAGITDGTSNTVFVGHGNIALNQYSQSAGVTGCSNVFDGGTVGTMRSGNDAVNGIAPIGVTLQRDSEAPPGVGSWGGPFPAGALMCMGDGTIRIFPYQTANFSAFLTPNGGEPVFFPN